MFSVVGVRGVIRRREKVGSGGGVPGRHDERKRRVGAVTNNGRWWVTEAVLLEDGIVDVDVDLTKLELHDSRFVWMKKRRLI